jgi:simple sugar transport system substrate-binding protein
MSRFGPKAQLTSIVDDWGPYYIQRTQEVLAGTWKTGSVWLGMKEGMVTLAPYGPSMTEAARTAADKVKAGIIDGSVQPFSGPIKDQKGEQKLAAGKTMTDEEMQKLNWYVDGVQA